MSAALNFSHAFTQAFHAANGLSVVVYCGLIRFIAVMCVILAVMGSLQQFLSMEAKESEGFMLRLGTRLVRLAIGMTLFILFLTL